MMTTDSSRRGFFAAASAFAALGLVDAADAKVRKKKKAPVNTSLLGNWAMGVQLWTVNAQMKTDIPGTLKSLKSTGFDVIETAGLYDGTAETLKRQLKDAGLGCRSCHVNMGALVDNIDTHIANAQTLGATWLVCSSPKTPGPIDSTKPWVQAMTEAMTLDAYKQNADYIAMLAHKVHSAGLKFAYHNHPMEFADLGGGVTGYDLFVQASDLLRLELDLGWVAAAGLDCAATLRKYAGRVDLLHVKDMVKDGSDYRSVEVGRGMVDWKSALKAARDTKVQGFFVEQEEPFLKLIFESLGESVAYLRKV